MVVPGGVAVKVRAPWSVMLFGIFIFPGQCLIPKPLYLRPWAKVLLRCLTSSTKGGEGNLEDTFLLYSVSTLYS